MLRTVLVVFMAIMRIEDSVGEAHGVGTREIGMSIEPEI
jgi:hypothetical protein